MKKRLSNRKLKEIIQKDFKENSSFDIDLEYERLLDRLEREDIAFSRISEESGTIIPPLLKPQPRISINQAFSIGLVFITSFSVVMKETINYNVKPELLKGQVLTSLVIDNGSSGVEKPEFDLTINKSGYVTDFVPVNYSAKIVVGVDSYSSLGLKDATAWLLDKARDTGFLLKTARKELPNKIAVEVSGLSEDIAMVKSELETSVKSYLADNKIYAYLIDSSLDNTALKEEAEFYGVSVEQYQLLLKLYNAGSKVSFRSLEEVINKYKSKTIEELTALVAELSGTTPTIDSILSIDQLKLKVDELYKGYDAEVKTLYPAYISQVNEFMEQFDRLSMLAKRDYCRLDLKEIKYNNLEFEYVDFEDVLDWIFEYSPARSNSKPAHFRSVYNRYGDKHDDDDDDDDDDRDDDRDEDDHDDWYDDDWFEDWFEDSMKPPHYGNKVCSEETIVAKTTLIEKAELVEENVSALNELNREFKLKIGDLIKENEDVINQEMKNQQDAFNKDHYEHIDKYKDLDDRDEDFYEEFEDYFEDFFKEKSSWDFRPAFNKPLD